MWPSGDGSRIYVGLENADALVAIDTITNRVVANIPIGQAPQAIAYVPNAVPEGEGTDNLQQLGVAGKTAHLTLSAVKGAKVGDIPPTSVSLFDQGLVQVFQASVTSLKPKQPYVVGALRSRRWPRSAAAAGGVHDQPGRLGHRQRCRPDPSVGAD